MVKVVAAGRAVSPLIMERNMHKPLYMDQTMVAHIISSAPKVGLWIYDPYSKAFNRLDRKNYIKSCEDFDLDVEKAKGKSAIENLSSVNDMVKDYEEQGWPKYKVEPPSVEPPAHHSP